MPLPNHLLKIERSLWTNDAEVYERTLVEDTVLVFAETGVITRDTALAAIRQENSDGRRWASVEFDDVRYMSATAARLKRETSNDLLSFGGADVAATLQQHGLIDEYHLLVNPSVFGSGVPFFRHSVDLKLLDAREFKTGMVALRYATPP